MDLLPSPGIDDRRAHLLGSASRKGGHATVGCLIEQSLIGESYIRNFRKACAAQGIRVVGEEWIAQTAQDVTGAVQKFHESNPDALVHCGFGFGVLGVNRCSMRSAGTRLDSWAPHSRTPGSMR